MRKNAALLLLLVATPLLAQPAPAPEPDGDTKDDVDVGGVISGSTTVKLTLEEMQAKIVELDATAEADVRHVVRLQLTARKEKDIIKLNCINDKLLQMKALHNILETTQGEFEATATEEDRNFQFVRITLTAENIRQLKEEANGCAGESPEYVTDRRVDWTGPDVPDDPTDDLFEPEIEAPGYASPFS